MDNEKIAIEEFKRDFLIKTLVQEEQFEQWLRSLFFLNNELTTNYDFVYQEAFYIKFHELFTDGLSYANKVLVILKKVSNDKKYRWYLNLITGLNQIKSELKETELQYIEYRRHNSCHIFQNGYEHIQENFKIKKDKNGKKLHDINTELKKIILEHGSDKNFDFYINSKLQPKFKALYNLLAKS